jgi:aspartyl aminopeptidase
VVSSTRSRSCNDHEEVGSVSMAGAQGPMLPAMLARLCPQREDRERALARSLLVSADNAHGVHPNFADKHDGNHGPLLNAGAGDQGQRQPALRHQQRNRGLVPLAVRAEGCRCRASWCAATWLRQHHRPADRGKRVGVRTVDVGVPTLRCTRRASSPGRTICTH